MKTLALLSLLISLANFGTAQARVYKNVKVGTYRSVIDLNDYTNQPFFNVMKDVIYPEINRQAANRRNGRHLDGIKNGEGVEVILTSGVTTYHVKYKADHEDKVERSGRSFGAIGFGHTKRYIADASYKHYLRSLESILKGDDRDVEAFFGAILRVITNSDPSKIAGLDRKSQQVAADFVAIYIAEQYRRLTSTKGKYLGRSHRWDDALVQVTLVSAFHSGQEEMAMFYEGEFTDKVYNQSECLYKARGEKSRRETARKRKARLYDYWQFTVRSECPGRSGVNLTRRDFEKLGKILTKEFSINSDSSLKSLDFGKAFPKNIIKTATEDLLTGSFNSNSIEYAETLVHVLMSFRAEADRITFKLLR